MQGKVDIVHWTRYKVHTVWFGQGARYTTVWCTDINQGKKSFLRYDHKYDLHDHHHSYDQHDGDDDENNVTFIYRIYQCSILHDTYDQFQCSMTKKIIAMIRIMMMMTMKTM